MKTTLLSRPGRFFLSFCLLLFFAAPAFAGNADKLNGTWVVDLPATFKILSADEELPAEAKKEFEALFSTIKVTFDIPGKKFTGQQDGKPAETGKIETITENPDGSVHIEGELQDDVYVFQADGTVLVRDADIVLKRAK